MKSKRVVSSGVTESSAVTGDLSIVNVISDFTTDEETVSANNSITSKSGAFEEVEAGAGEEVVLFVFNTEFGVLGAVLCVDLREGGGRYYSNQ